MCLTGGLCAQEVGLMLPLLMGRAFSLYAVPGCFHQLQEEGESQVRSGKCDLVCLLFIYHTIFDGSHHGKSATQWFTIMIFTAHPIGYCALYLNYFLQVALLLSPHFMGWGHVEGAETSVGQPGFSVCFPLYCAGPNCGLPRNPASLGKL